MFLPSLIVSLCLAPGDGVPLFVVDDFGTLGWKKNHIAAFRILRVEDRVKKATSYPYSYWTTHPRAKYMSAKTLRGFVYTVDRSGQLTQDWFVTLPSADLYKVMVSEHVESLEASMPAGLTATVTKREDITTVSNPEYELAGLPGAKAQQWEVSFRFSDPLLITGVGLGSDKSLQTIPMAEVKRLAGRAQGHSWFLLYRPDEVSAANREAMLQSIVAAAAPGLQQRDEESDSAYRTRINASESQLELLRQLLNDVEQAVGSTSWPTEEEPHFRGKLSLTARKGSGLASLLRGLSLSRGMQIQQGSVGRLNLALGVPQVLKPLLQSLLTRFDIGLEGLRTGIKDGRFAASLELDLTEQGRLAVRGVSSVPASKQDIDRHGLREYVPSSEGVGFAKLTWRLRTEDYGCSFDVSNGQERPRPIPEVTETRSPALVDLVFDFKSIQFAQKDSPILKSVQNAETVYIRKKFFDPRRLVAGDG